MVPECLCYGSEAAPRRGLWAMPSGGRGCCWGVQDEAGGVQLLFTSAVDRQVRYFPQVWERQEYQGRDFRERT